MEPLPPRSPRKEASLATGFSFSRTETGSMQNDGSVASLAGSSVGDAAEAKAAAEEPNRAAVDAATAVRQRGVCVWYCGHRKIGFVKPEAAADEVFVHRGDLLFPGTLLSAGDVVEYAVAARGGRLAALDVVRVPTPSPKTALAPAPSPAPAAGSSAAASVASSVAPPPPASWVDDAKAGEKAALLSAALAAVRVGVVDSGSSDGRDSTRAASPRDVSADVLADLPPRGTGGPSLAEVRRRRRARERGAASLAKWLGANDARGPAGGRATVAIKDDGLDGVFSAPYFAGAGVDDVAWTWGDPAPEGDTFLLVADTIVGAVAAARALAVRADQAVAIAPGGADAEGDGGAACRRLASALEGADFFAAVFPENGVVVASPVADECDPYFLAKRTELAFDTGGGGPDVSVAQSPDGADGFGGLVWPNSVALARWLALREKPLGGVLELGAGTGFLGLALCASGVATSALLTDEFVGLCAHNAATVAANRDAARLPQLAVDVRRLRWGHPDDGGDDRADVDTVVGAELTPMSAGHEALAGEIARLLDARRGRRCVLALSPCPRVDAVECGCKAPCHTHAFLAAARRHKGLRLDALHTDCRASKENDADVAGLDLAWSDDADVFWVAEFENAGDAARPRTAPAPTPPLVPQVTPPTLTLETRSLDAASGASSSTPAGDGPSGRRRSLVARLAAVRRSKSPRGCPPSPLCGARASPSSEGDLRPQPP